MNSWYYYVKDITLSELGVEGDLVGFGAGAEGFDVGGVEVVQTVACE
jgi:hypothetical protein